MNQENDYSVNFYFIPTFSSIATEGSVTFSQLRPSADWIDGNDWLGTIQYGGEEEAQLSFDGEHWYVVSVTAPDYEHEVGDIVDDVEVPLYRGMIVYSDMAAPITVCGSVLKGDSELVTDYSVNCYSGNCTPVDITLGDIVPSADWIPDNDWLGTIQYGGEEVAQFTYDGENWVVAAVTDPSSELVEGEIANDYPVKAGAGLIIYSDMGASVSIPSPLAD